MDEPSIQHIKDGMDYIRGFIKGKNNGNIDENGRIFIHCIDGITISPTLVLCWFINEYQKSANDAFKILKDKRNTVSEAILHYNPVLYFSNNV